MNDSGMRKQRIRDGRRAVLAFFRSKNLKTIIDIKGLAHADVEKIVFGNPAAQMLMAVRFLVSMMLYPLPFSGLKVLFFRLCGARIGKNVYISPGVYIDMINPALLTIGNNVMIGMAANIAVHERTMETLSLGRVTIGSEVTIGGLTIIRHATTIGDHARIDMMCNITKSVPPHTAIIGNRNGAVHYGKDL
jgi:acetyltransferase-like isoleucine patch superfamily enzyme